MVSVIPGRAEGATGEQIKEYFERTARDYGVLERVRFGDEVVSLRYEDGGWNLATAAGFHDRFDVVIAATGVLHHPNVPHFPGIEAFSGATFHSARWDHSVPLDGKRIGVIGTGSTAAQLVTALVPRSGRFDLFQRTPQWVLPRPNPAYTDEDKARFRADPVAGIRARFFQFQHCHFGGTDPRAAGHQAIAVQVMLQRRDRPCQRRHHAELVGDHAGEMIGRLANSDHRTRCN